MWVRDRGKNIKTGDLVTQIKAAVMYENYVYQVLSGQSG